MRLRIERDWQGAAVPATEHAWLAFERRGDSLAVEFDAPYFGDPRPPGATGPTPGLWDYEVIELFIADDAEHYLELEFGPHGHYLALELSGVRKVARAELPLSYTVEIDPGVTGAPIGRYRGAAEAPMSYLPRAPTRVNAYTIHGRGPTRAYRAHAPVPGTGPDFHRLSCFVPLHW